MLALSKALLYGGLAGFSLYFGALAALTWQFPRRWVSLFMAFGAGVLISSASFGLMEEAFRKGGFAFALPGLLLGALFYYLFHQITVPHPLPRGLHLYRLEEDKEGRPGKWSSILMGTVLDGIPEQFAIGFGVWAGSNLGLMVMAAVFLSNLSEAVVATSEMRRRPAGEVKRLWLIISLISTAAALGGFLFAEHISPALLGLLLAFAAGAVLAMIADTLLPEAYHGGGRAVSLATVMGFMASFILSRLSP